MRSVSPGSGISGLGTRRFVKFALAGMTAALVAGCADSRNIFGDPLGNPFKSAGMDATPTGSIDGSELAPPRRRTHTASVESEALAAPSGPGAAYDAPVHASPRLSPDYQPPKTERTASIVRGKGGWSVSGGMAVIAASGESAKILADRYNVPMDVLVRINGFSSAAQIRPGTRVVIPVYSTAYVSEDEKSAKTVLKKPNVREPKERVVVKRDKGKIVVAKEKPRHEAMRWVKGPTPAKQAEAEAAKTRKGLKQAEAKKAAKVEEAEDDAAPAPQKMKTASVKVPAAKVHAPVQREADASPAEERRSEKAVDPTPTASLPPSPEKQASASGNPEFRWPARGRIIQGFRMGGNDGINIAVPEGTAVKAAESGVVAYAGSEIKGFGNLVLIRHPNGYVTAYANNGSLDVKRGEQVKRGQVIARSGQSGNVQSPQLHFELRKGSTPVDPTRYLAGL